MKGGVAAMMLAMEELNKKKLECEVMLQLVTDEEISGDYGSGFLTENEYIGDFVIVQVLIFYTLIIRRTSLILYTLTSITFRVIYV